MQTTLRKLTVAWPLMIFLLLPTPARAETVAQAWVQRYNGPGNGADDAYVVAVDGSDNVIVTGLSYNGTNDDYATIKYSSAGVPLWTNRYNGPGNNIDWALAMVMDSSDNVIVTGYSTASSHDYATIKYSSTGVPLWTNRYGSVIGDDVAYAVAVDHSDNVIVTGYSYNDSGSSIDYATIKYSSAGVPLWTNRYNGPGNGFDEAYAMAVDGSNNVIVTGYSTGSGTYDDYATIKYSSAGAPLWTNRYNGPRNDDDVAYAVAVDGNNDVIVTGYPWSINSRDYATIKYSSAGVPLWTNRYDGPGNSTDDALAVAVDRSGNVIVTGYSYGSGSSWDYATIKYSSAGIPLWTNRYNGPGNGLDEARAVTVDRSGNVIVTGISTGSGGNYDFVTVKYICVPSPVMTGLQLTNGTFQMRADDVLQPGTLVIEASTNLAGWSPVLTNTTPTNVLFYTDPDAGNYPWRFYRAFQFP
jgi:uncharacterized delta-60 repeat protein